MAQAAVVVLCDICETEEDVQFFCVNCEENLCKNCKIYHSRSKKTKNDKIILISEARAENITKTPVILCADHSTEEVAIYCRHCDKLICTECLTGIHQGHNLTSLKQMKNTATDQLVNMRKKLRDRKLSFDDTLKAEGKVHAEYMASIKKCRKDISIQKDKMIEELNIICEEEFAELTSLEEKETKRYSETCSNIQKKQQLVTTALQTVQNGIESGHPASMLQAREDATKSTRALVDLAPAQLHPHEFQPVQIERRVLRQHFGGVHTKSSATRANQVMADFEEESDVKRHAPTINIGEIDVKVKTRSTMKAKGISGRIKVIIPTKNNCTWVLAPGDTNLTLISDKGDTITTSVIVDSSGIVDAKAYNNDILVTSNKGKVFRLLEEGTIKSTFSDLQPYITYGLCVTSEMDVLVCLYQSESDNKVVRLGKNGNIIQTIQKDSTGRPLFSCPYRVTAAQSGEIIVTQGNPGKVTCVDRDGQHLFTWTGQLEERQTDRCTTCSVAEDNYNVFVTDSLYSKVYVLKKDGTVAKCLLDHTQGVVNPWGLALNDHGQLLVGCSGGKIHVIEY